MKLLCPSNSREKKDPEFWQIGTASITWTHTRLADTSRHKVTIQRLQCQDNVPAIWSWWWLFTRTAGIYWSIFNCIYENKINTFQTGHFKGYVIMSDNYELQFNDGIWKICSRLTLFWQWLFLIDKLMCICFYVLNIIEHRLIEFQRIEDLG